MYIVLLKKVKKKVKRLYILISKDIFLSSLYTSTPAVWVEVTSNVSIL